jgi:pimeloyl-ACP methyl ester carboxylesterase
MPIHEINGTNMHYHVSGHGTPLIFIHPPLLNSQNFNYQKAQLSERYKVITFDIRGHGLSSRSEQPITYDLIVEDIKQLMNHLGIDKAYLCGYSTGGSIVLEALLTYPDRFLGGVLISAMSEVSDAWLKFRLSLAIKLSSMKASRLLSAAISWGNADMLLTFKNLYKGAIQGDIENMEQYYRYSLVYNCTNQLKQIHHPVLLMYGDKDKGFYRYAKKLFHELPFGTLYFIDKMKHQIPTKAAYQMNELIDHWIDFLENEPERSKEAEERNQQLEGLDLPGNVYEPEVTAPKTDRV